MKIVAYIRTSHKERHRSGLGEEAQLSLIQRYAEDTDQDIIACFSDVDTGSNNDRPGLTWAISVAAASDAVLVVAKLDRLSRQVEFIARLMNTIDFKVAETPQADKFQLHMYAAFAELERDMISKRTKAALAARRARGLPLGSAAVIAAKGRPVTLNGIQSRLAGVPGYVRTSLMAKQHRTRSGQLIDEIDRGRWHTDKTIAAELNRRGERTYLGVQWTARRVGELRRYGCVAVPKVV